MLQLQITVVVAFLINLWNLTYCGQGTKWLDPNVADDVCVSKECIITAAKFVENLDTSVDPCSNFFSFSCGGFAENKLPVNGLTDVFLQIMQNAKTKLKKLLRVPKRHLHSRYDKMKEFYDSCVNIASIEDLGLTPLHQLLDKYGGWPLVKGSKWNEKKFDWAQTIFRIYGDGLSIKNRKLKNTDVFLGLDFFDNSQGSAKSSQFVLPQIIFPGLPSLRKNTTVTKDLPDFKLSVELAVLLGANREYAENELEKTYIFVGNLVEALHSRSADTNKTDVPKAEPDYGYVLKVSKVEDLYSITDKMDWLALLEIVFSQWITGHSEIIISGRKDLFPLIKDTFNEAPKRVVANLVMDALARRHVELIESKRWQEIRLKFSKNRPQLQSRRKKCLVETDENFLHVLTAMHVRNYFSPRDKIRINETYSLIRLKFKEILHNVDWLSPETLLILKNKMNELRAFLVYPDEVLDDDKLQEFYENLEIYSDEYFRNVLNIQKFHQIKNSDCIDKYEPMTHWNEDSSLLSRDVYYRDRDNTIIMSAPIIRGFYYGDDQPEALNFGSIGSILGHEILHAFNAIADIYPNVHESRKWWNKEDTKIFMDRSKCIINQYEKYGVRRVGKHNGSETLDENISDNLGAVISYRAYQDWVNKHGSGKRLPGLAFNSNQLFWMAYASNWCVSFGLDKLRVPNMYWPHSMHQFRVIGTVSNSKEFSEDFNCPVGSPMNPENKCSVW